MILAVAGSSPVSYPTVQGPFSGPRTFLRRSFCNLVAPCGKKEFSKSGKIPDWVGVDLLRAWAFLVARNHNHHRMTDTYSCCPDIYMLATAVQQHKAATKKDFPPPIPPILLEPYRPRG